MKCYVYSFYNKKVGAYEKPIINNWEPKDFGELVRRDVLVSDNDAKDKMKETDLYYLGLFDDAVAAFELEAKPEFLFSVGELVVGKQGDN